jgi:hypothetical protein
VIHGFATRSRGFNRDRKVFFDLGLSDELAQTLWPQLKLERRIVFNLRSRHQTVIRQGIVLEGIHDIAMVKRNPFTRNAQSPLNY